jgi:hypothetical protein
MVTFVGGAPNKRVASYVAALPSDERDDVDTLLTLLRLCSRKTIDAPDIAARMQKGAEAAEAVLRRLAEFDRTCGAYGLKRADDRLRASVMAEALEQLRAGVPRDLDSPSRSRYPHPVEPFRHGLWAVQQHYDLGRRSQV